MCEQCEAGCNGWGEVLPGLFLVRATKNGDIMEKGDWGLVVSNDPSFIFEIAPIPDPFDGMSDDEQNAMESALADKLSDEWDAAVLDFKKDIYQRLEEVIEATNERDQLWGAYSVAALLVGPAIEAGYDSKKDGSLERWIFNRIGKFIKANPIPSQLDYDEDGFGINDLQDQFKKLDIKNVSVLMTEWDMVHKYDIASSINREIYGHIEHICPSENEHQYLVRDQSSNLISDTLHSAREVAEFWQVHIAGKNASKQHI